VSQVEIRSESEGKKKGHFAVRYGDGSKGGGSVLTQTDSSKQNMAALVGSSPISSRLEGGGGGGKFSRPGKSLSRPLQLQKISSMKYARESLPVWVWREEAILQRCSSPVIIIQSLKKRKEEFRRANTEQLRSQGEPGMERFQLS